MNSVTEKTLKYNGFMGKGNNTIFQEHERRQFSLNFGLYNSTKKQQMQLAKDLFVLTRSKIIDAEVYSRRENIPRKNFSADKVALVFGTKDLREDIGPIYESALPQAMPKAVMDRWKTEEFNQLNGQIAKIDNANKYAVMFIEDDFFGAMRFALYKMHKEKAIKFGFHSEGTIKEGEAILTYFERELSAEEAIKQVLENAVAKMYSESIIFNNLVF